MMPATCKLQSEQYEKYWYRFLNLTFHFSVNNVNRTSYLHYLNTKIHMDEPLSTRSCWLPLTTQMLLMASRIRHVSAVLDWSASCPSLNNSLSGSLSELLLTLPCPAVTSLYLQPQSIPYHWHYHFTWTDRQIPQDLQWLTTGEQKDNVSQSCWAFNKSFRR